jgi:hypothetical protein
MLTKSADESKRAVPGREFKPPEETKTLDEPCRATLSPNIDAKLDDENNALFDPYKLRTSAAEPAMALPDSATLFAPARLSTLPALTIAAAPDASVRELPPYRLAKPADVTTADAGDESTAELPPYTLASDEPDTAAALAPEAKKLAALPRLTTPLALPTRLVPPSRYSALPPYTLIVSAADRSMFESMASLSVLEWRERRSADRVSASVPSMTTLLDPKIDTRSLTDDK